MDLHPIDELDAGATLAALEEGVRHRRSVEVEDLLLVAHWADLHASDPRLDPRPTPGLPRPPGGDRLERVGGEGTPRVRELSLCELGVARGVHTLAARAAVADVLDLRHRLPHIWALVRDLEAEPWVARKVASLSRRLSADVVHLVDEAVAAAIAGETPGRVIAIAEAKVIEADRAAYDERRRQEQRRRHVSLTRTDATGLRDVIARVTAGDAAWVDATLTRVAEILASRPEHDGASRDLLRSLAFGWLARPAELLTLLLESHDVPAEVGEEPGATRPPRRTRVGRRPSGRWPCPPSSSERCAPSTRPDCARGPVSTSTSTRPCSSGCPAWPGSRASARTSSRSSATCWGTPAWW